MNEYRPHPDWVNKEFEEKISTPFLYANLGMSEFGPYVRNHLHLLSNAAITYLGEADNINKIVHEEILGYLLEQQLIDNE